jgi:hypothetical protein
MTGHPSTASRGGLVPGAGPGWRRRCRCCGGPGADAEGAVEGVRAWLTAVSAWPPLVVAQLGEVAALRVEDLGELAPSSAVVGARPQLGGAGRAAGFPGDGLAGGRHHPWVTVASRRRPTAGAVVDHAPQAVALIRGAAA